MLEVALTVVAVAATLSGVAVAVVFAKAQSRLLEHLKDTTQIGGTPVGLATKQTEFEMARMNDARAEHDRLVTELKAMKGESAIDKGGLS